MNKIPKIDKRQLKILLKEGYTHIFKDEKGDKHLLPYQGGRWIEYTKWLEDKLEKVDKEYSIEELLNGDKS